MILFVANLINSNVYKSLLKFFYILLEGFPEALGVVGEVPVDTWFLTFLDFGLFKYFFSLLIYYFSRK